MLGKVVLEEDESGQDLKKKAEKKEWHKSQPACKGIAPTSTATLPASGTSLRRFPGSSTCYSSRHLWLHRATSLCIERVQGVQFVALTINYIVAHEIVPCAHACIAVCSTSPVLAAPSFG